MIVGPDIYGTSNVAREVYALRAEVRPGDSGGPLVAPDGTVVGIVFAASLDDPETAYAFTAARGAAGDHAQALRRPPRSRPVECA